MRILTELNISKAKEEAENTLITNPKIKFTFNRKWSHNFLQQAGVYAIFDKGKLCYIGHNVLKVLAQDYKRYEKKSRFK